MNNAAQTSSDLKTNLLTSSDFHEVNNIDVVLDNEEEYKEYKYRYVIILIFALPNLINAIMWVTCSPIAKTLEDVYGIDSFMVNLASTIYMLTYIPINFPAEYILDDISLRLGIFLGSAFTIAGAWVRIAANQSFNWVIVGQTLNGIGQPFILNSPAKIAAVWFKPENRVIATTVLSVINILGVGIGFLIPGAFVSGDDTNETSKDNFFSLLLTEAIMATILIVPVFIFFKEKPDSPPSFAAETKKLSFQTAIGTAFRNKNFIFLLITFSFVMGNYNCLATIVDLVMKPFGFSEGDSGALGAVMIIAGLIGAGFFGWYVEVTKLYKTSILICLVGFMSSIFMMGFVLFSENIVLNGIACFLMGFAAMPLLPLCFDLACEVTFPVGEAFTTGLLMMGGQIIGVIEVLIFDFAFGSEEKINSVEAASILFVLTFFGLIACVIMKQDLVRSKKEDVHHSITQSIRQSMRKSHLSNVHAHVFT